MPALPRVRARRPRGGLRRPGATASAPRLPTPRVVVVGDLVLDVSLVPERALVSGTDVPGRVLLRQGGSAATTARWLARLGARSSLVCVVGRDPAGRALVAELERDGVRGRVVRAAGRPTGRVGVLVAPGGERSFVADRGAADLLRPEDLRGAWFRRADAVHLPAYSLLGEPLGTAGRAAIERLLEYAPLAVIKRGSAGATVLERGLPPQEVATTAISAADTTGAGDAFDAGFLVTWLAARRAGRTPPSALHRAVLAGHRAAARHLSTERPEIDLG